MRPPAFRGSFDVADLVVDNFAGGGGVSTGAAAALGRPVDIAINHSAKAIAMHAANHPETHHFIEDILQVDPATACAGRRVGLAWFSPDCTHHSRAKGGQPRRKDIRGLAWVVIRWAREVRPRVIALENVEEFANWGPLDDEGYPIKSRAGEEFREWLAELVACGYRVEHRSLVAADYGVPTTRRRLFLVARCDGAPIVWPAPTHGPGRPLPWRAAASIIDWSIPCPSIFERARPLADATMRRIAMGIRKYVVGARDPFVVPLTHQGPPRAHGIREPLRTVTAAHRGELALVEPFIVRHGHYSKVTGAGLREGCGAGLFRGQRLGAPLATVCATNDKHVVVPVITKHFGGGPTGHPTPGASVESPLGTVTARDHSALSAAFLTKFYGTSVGADARAPLPTVTANGRGGGHLAEVLAFLVKYHGGTEAQGARGQLVLEPLRTVDTNNRFGLVTIRGEDYQIVDVGMRMLQPTELFGANGFPSKYIIDPIFNGKPLTKTDQIVLCGNAVPPGVAEQVIAANVRVAA